VPFALREHAAQVLGDGLDDGRWSWREPSPEGRGIQWGGHGSRCGRDHRQGGPAAWVARLPGRCRGRRSQGERRWRRALRRVDSPEQGGLGLREPAAAPKAFALPQTERWRASARGTAATPWSQPPSASSRSPDLRSCDVKGMAFLRRMFTAEPAGRGGVCGARRLLLGEPRLARKPAPWASVSAATPRPFLHEVFDVQHHGSRHPSARGKRERQGPRAASVVGGRLLPPPAQARTSSGRSSRGAGEALLSGTETCHYRVGDAARLTCPRGGGALGRPWRLVPRMPGACRSLCAPGVYCFSVADRRETAASSARRTWDSCQFAAFTGRPPVRHPERERSRPAGQAAFTSSKLSAQLLGGPPWTAELAAWAVAAA